LGRGILVNTNEIKLFHFWDHLRANSVKLLLNFIDNHYIGSERTELISLLDSFKLTSILDNVLSFHQNTLKVGTALSTDKVMPIATDYAQMALTAIKLKLSNEESSDKLIEVRKALIQLGLRLYVSFIRQFPDEMLEITSALKNSLPGICQSIGFDYGEINQHFNIEQLEVVIKQISGEAYADMRPISKRRSTRLEWRSEAQLDFLAHELKMKNWIKKKSEWISFLDAKRVPSIFHWNEKKKSELAYLLYALYTGGFIKPTGTKGYFAIAEVYARDYSGKKFAKRSLTKLSSKINTKMEEHIDLKKIVNDLIRHVKPK